MHKSLHAYFPPYPNPYRRIKSSTIAAVAIARAPGVSGGDKEARNEEEKGKSPLRKA